MPEGFEGRSWAPLLREQPQADEAETGAVADPTAFADAGAYQRHLRSIQDGEWQLVLRPPNRDREKPTIELYHLPSDPLQQRDVASEFPEVKDRLGRQLSRWIRDSPQNVTPHTEAARKALEAMGYLE